MVVHNFIVCKTTSELFCRNLSMYMTTLHLLGKTDGRKKISETKLVHLLPH